ncbi:hypothetical protein V490_04718 [Pseudogymnoascus sp. VKM F-3557]|nr:hypothetical protein V490_04718 [Pseudogymnoascus sp. VKM F-3557]
MDEIGFRIGIPGGERVIVPRIAKQLYTPSLENRLSITILETVSAPSSFKELEQGLQRWKTKLTGLLSSPSQKSYSSIAASGGTEKGQLRGLGVEARKQERLRKKRVRALTKAGNPIPPEDQDPIPDPEAGSEASSEVGSEVGSEASSEAGFERGGGGGGGERGGSEPEPEPGFEPRFELELEPGFELEVEPGSGLPLSYSVLTIFGGRERTCFRIELANALASDPDYRVTLVLPPVLLDSEQENEYAPQDPFWWNYPVRETHSEERYIVDTQRMGTQGAEEENHVETERQKV